MFVKFLREILLVFKQADRLATSMTALTHQGRH